VNKRKENDRMEKIQAAKLVQDMNLYPRHYVNPYHVTTLREALKAGIEFPPVIADRETRKVIDGFHRIAALLRHLGDAVEVAVEWRDYKDEAEMFQDAIRLNANHGQKLYKTDWVRCAAIGEDLGITVEIVADCLSITVEKLEHVCEVRTTANGDRAKSTVLKPGQEKWAGKRLSAKQQAAVRSTFGEIKRFAAVLASNLEAQLVDLDDAEFVEELVKLKRVLDQVLEPITVEKAA
jgi:hypothetical protein